MNLLSAIIAILFPDEREKFRKYLYSLSTEKKGKKEKELFELLVTHPEWTVEEIHTKLYPVPNKSAYLGTRKRLLRRLNDFIRSQQSDPGHESVNGHLVMVQFGARRKSWDIVRHYLNLAEEDARAARRYDLLETVYFYMTEYAPETGQVVEEIEVNWRKNTAKLESFRRLQLTSSEVKQQLTDARRKGDLVDFQQVLDTVSRNARLSIEEANDPQFLFKVAGMVRHAMIAVKDYHRLAPFVQKIYLRLKKNKAFIASDRELELGFLMMIGHAWYRSGQFHLATRWLDRIPEIISEEDLPGFAHGSKYFSMRATLASFSGDNSKGIRLLEEALANETMITDVDERINMKLNLCVLYFQAELYKKANQAMISIGETDRTLELRMGKEWRYKKCMIEVILQVELGNFDIAENLMAQIERYFHDFLDQPIYQRAKLFMGFVRQLIRNPEDARTPEFRQSVIDARLAWPGAKEDIQAITFFCWVRSKMEGRRYYDVLLDRLAEMPQMEEIPPESPENQLAEM